MRVLLAMSSRMGRPDDSQPGARRSALHKKESQSQAVAVIAAAFTGE